MSRGPAVLHHARHAFWMVLGALALLAVFAWYLHPDLVVLLAQQVFACF